jgi:acetoin utilization protein AcuB
MLFPALAAFYVGTNSSSNHSAFFERNRRAALALQDGNPMRYTHGGCGKLSREEKRMLVGRRMSHPVISANPQMPVADALNLMHRERIRRLPVIDNGRLVGIVSDKDLLYASPSPATSLSVWEVTYLLGKLTVEMVMSRQVATVTEDTPLEEAARIMVDNKIGGLPVMRGLEVVGIITETSLFKIFMELLGARELGIRLTILVPDEKGEIAKLATAIADIGGNIVAMGTFTGESPDTRQLTIKVAGPAREELLHAIQPIVLKVIDIRETTLLHEVTTKE